MKAHKYWSIGALITMTGVPETMVCMRTVWLRE